MKKFICLIFLTFIIACYCYSQNVELTVNITNIAINGGKVYLAIFSNAESFKKEEPDFAFELQDNNTQASYKVSIPPGEYVVFVFQDANKNEKMDSNFLGIPKELIGISNYSGKGLPSRNFNKQKIKIDNSTGLITLGLYRF